MAAQMTTAAANSNYQEKADNAFTEATKAWWNSLTKEEILAYIYDQKDITADVLRDLLKNENTHLSFGISFSTNGAAAKADFLGANLK